MKKFIVLIKKLIKFLIELILFPLTLVVLLSSIIFFWSFRKRKVSKKALFVGLENVIDKTAIRGEKMKKLGFHVFYYSKELTKIQTENYKINLYKSSKFFFFDIFTYCILLFTINPAYIEIYFTGRHGNGLNQLIYTLLGVSYNRIVAVILRGELFYYESLSIIYKYAIKYTCKFCSTIFYRETYMKKILNQFKLDLGKVHFDPNKVEVKPLKNYDRKGKTVLFLNSFKTWRRIELLINAIPEITKKIPESEFLLVGYRNNNEKKQVIDYINKLPGDNYNIKILSWTTKPKHYFEKASVYVLPADLVYVNFSLLEAMERGLPAVIADVEDADKIIDHGATGFLSKQIPEEFSYYIVKLLSNENQRKQIGQNARKKIINDFNDKYRMDIIFKLIKNKYLEVEIS